MLAIIITFYLKISSELIRRSIETKTQEEKKNLRPSLIRKKKNSFF